MKLYRVRMTRLVEQTKEVVIASKRSLKQSACAAAETEEGWETTSWEPETLSCGTPQEIKLLGPEDTPAAGDLIYVDTAYYCDHGQNNVRGGLARVTGTEMRISAGKPTLFVLVEQHPGRSMNWEFLALEQHRLAAQFGAQWAYPDPERR